MSMEKEFGQVLIPTGAFKCSYERAAAFRHEISKSTQDEWSPKANIVEGGVQVSLRDCHVTWLVDRLKEFGVPSAEVVGVDGAGRRFAQEIRAILNRECLVELRKGSK